MTCASHALLFSFVEVLELDDDGLFLQCGISNMALRGECHVWMALLRLPPMIALAQMQQEAPHQPLTLVFKAPEQQQGLARLRQKIKVTVKVPKGERGFEDIQQQEVLISDKPVVVPGIFVARQAGLPSG